MTIPKPLFSLCVTLILLCSFQHLPAHATEPKKVLIIHSYDPQFPLTVKAQQGIEEVLGKYGKDRVQFQVDYLDAKQYSEPEYLSGVLDVVYRYKLAKRTFGLVLAVDNDAYNFVLRHRKGLFAGLPVVFCGVNDFDATTIAGDTLITGVADSPSYRDTIDTALRLHPGTEEIIFIGSTGNETGRSVHAALLRLQPQFESRTRFTFWDELPIEEISDRLRSLPPNRLIFIYGFVKDRSGFVLSAGTNISRIRGATTAPIYSFWEFFLGNGIVGGKLVSHRKQGEMGAELAVKILQGAAPASIPVIGKEANNYQFDYRELQRFKIRNNLLPAGSRIINLPPSFYEVNRQLFWVAVITMLVLLGTSGFLTMAIVARKRIEKSLALEQSRLNTLLNTIPDPVWLKNTEGVYLACNARFQTLAGKGAEEILGKTDYDLFGNEEAGRFRDNDLAAIEAGGPRQNEELLTYNDGHREWTETIKTPMFDGAGRLIGVLGIGRNITGIREAEEALRLSESRLNEAQRVGGVGSWELDFGTKRLWWSDQTCRIFEVKESSIPEELFLSILHPDDRETVQRTFAESVERHIPYSMDHRLLMPDGRVKHVHTQCETSYDESGAPIRSLGMFQEITERKVAEEEQAKLAVQLRQAQKMEAIGRLAGGVAHDFNNKLMVIMGYAEMALHGDRVDEHLREHLDQILTAARHSQVITRQLLAFSRQEIISPQVIDINEQLTNVQKSLPRLIGEDIRFEIRVAHELWPIRIDPSQFDQIIMNLTLNARDSMPHGGMLIIETENVPIENMIFHLDPDARPGEYVKISISDTGCGMAPDVLDHIFEPFFTTKKPGEGTGLGLATVYGNVVQNNGFIKAYSEPGIGTTFNLYFPRTWTTVPTARAAAARIDTTVSATVLLVEDEEAVREVTAEMLKLAGYDVLVAESPLDARNICEMEQRPIDVVLTDVVMPQMNGREMVHQLASLRPGLKFVFMSGYTSEIIARKGVLEEGCHFIQKPFDIHKLKKQIQAALTGQPQGGPPYQAV